MKRVFVCADRRFPHGDAGGNRIEYLCQCLLHEGVQPIVISIGSNYKSDCIKDNVYKYRNIIYSNVMLKEGKRGVFQRYFSSGYRVGDLLKAFDHRGDEPVVIYTSNPIFARQIVRSQPDKIKRNVYYDVVEWFDSSCYKFGKWDPRLWIFNDCFNNIYSSGTGVIAISRNIKQHFDNLGCRTFYFPICLDYTQFENYSPLREDNVIRFIYPGNPEHKDDIARVIKSIALLEKSERRKLEFHFTAVSRNKIAQILGKDENLLDILSGTVIFHSWMEYDELLTLYRKMDALIMYRFENIVTKSNFPSKVPELMACGVVVIANDVGDFFSFLEDGKNAIKIRNNTNSGCIDAIRRYLSLSIEKRRQMSQNAISCVKKQFNFKKYAHNVSRFLCGVEDGQ